MQHADATSVIRRHIAQRTGRASTSRVTIGLRELPDCIDHVHYGELAALDENPRDLTLKRAGDIGWAGHLEITGTHGLHDPPSLVEDLYEASVVRQRADNKVLLLVKPDRVGMSGHAGNDRDPRCLRGAQR